MKREHEILPFSSRKRLSGESRKNDGMFTINDIRKFFQKKGIFLIVVAYENDSEEEQWYDIIPSLGSWWNRRY